MCTHTRMYVCHCVCFWEEKKKLSRRKIRREMRILPGLRRLRKKHVSCSFLLGTLIELQIKLIF